MTKFAAIFGLASAKVGNMDVLTTRALSYPDDNGDERELVLTVFVPFEAENEMWKCGFAFGPPIDRKVIYGVGGDFLQAVLGCVVVARGYLAGTDLGGRAHWGGMVDCGLPRHAERSSSLVPADEPPQGRKAEHMDVLTTRGLACSDEHGEEREIGLPVFVPFKAENEVWTCGFAFGPLLNSPIRYGSGADFLEALLDALTSARAHLEGTELKGRVHWAGMHDCGLPYKTGRSFWLDPVGETPQNAPDLYAG